MHIRQPPGCHAGHAIRRSDRGNNGLFTDIQGDSRVTQYSYAASSSVNMSVPIEKQTFNVSFGTTTSTTTQVNVLVVGGGAVEVRLMHLAAVAVVL